MLEHVARELDGANPILALPTNCLAEVARALKSLSKLDTELEASGAVVDLCRLLRFEAYALSLTADRVSHLADPAQLAYAAGLHNRGALRERSEEAALAVPEVDNVIDSIGPGSAGPHTAVAGRPGRALRDRSDLGSSRRITRRARTRQSR